MNREQVFLWFLSSSCHNFHFTHNTIQYYVNSLKRPLDGQYFCTIFEVAQWYWTLVDTIERLCNVIDGIKTFWNILRNLEILCRLWIVLHNIPSRRIWILLHNNKLKIKLNPWHYSSEALFGAWVQSGSEGSKRISSVAECGQCVIFFCIFMLFVDKSYLLEYYDFGFLSPKVWVVIFPILNNIKHRSHDTLKMILKVVWKNREHRIQTRSVRHDAKMLQPPELIRSDRLSSFDATCQSSYEDLRRKYRLDIIVWFSLWN